MFDKEKTIEDLECQGRHGEEVKCHNHLTVILQKRKPVLTGITATPCPAQISSDTSFRDNEAEF